LFLLFFGFFLSFMFLFLFTFFSFFFFSFFLSLSQLINDLDAFLLRHHLGDVDVPAGVAQLLLEELKEE